MLASRVSTTEAARTSLPATVLGRHSGGPPSASVNVRERLRSVFCTLQEGRGRRLGRGAPVGRTTSTGSASYLEASSRTACQHSVRTHALGGGGPGSFGAIGTIGVVGALSAHLFDVANLQEVRKQGLIARWQYCLMVREFAIYLSITLGLAWRIAYRRELSAREVVESKRFHSGGWGRRDRCRWR